MTKLKVVIFPEDPKYHRIMFVWKGLRNTVFGLKTEYSNNDIVRLLNDRGFDIEEIEEISKKELMDIFFENKG